MAGSSATACYALWLTGGAQQVAVSHEPVLLLVQLVDEVVVGLLPLKTLRLPVPLVSPTARVHRRAAAAGARGTRRRGRGSASGGRAHPLCR